MRKLLLSFRASAQIERAANVRNINFGKIADRIGFKFTRSRLPFGQRRRTPREPDGIKITLLVKAAHYTSKAAKSKAAPDGKRVSSHQIKFHQSPFCLTGARCLLISIMRWTGSKARFRVASSIVISGYLSRIHK